ncbi:MAG: hypothetical protein RTU30_10055 [Candidatus Thorarchaeota archaeon]
MPNMVSIVTGPIVGLSSTTFLNKTIDFGKQLGKEIVVFDLFAEILKRAEIDQDDFYERVNYIGELLDGYDYQFELMRRNAYLSIARQIDRLPESTNAVVRTPASIEWRGVDIELKDHRTIAEELRPDRIITLIDAEWKIWERLQSKYAQHTLGVVAKQKEMSLERILDWLATEVSQSEDWAEWASHLTGKNVRHFVLGTEIPSYQDSKVYVRDVDNMVKLVTEKELPTFYASYSMTVATDEVRSEINNLIWQLRNYGAVFDPASIELGLDFQSKEESVVFAYTVCRDLRWDVKKVDAVVAFHPYPDIPPLSTGMLDELGHARAFKKERYMVMPVGGGSPFTRDNIVPAKHFFKEGDAFFDYIETVRKPPLEPRFEDQTQKFKELSE